jgi:hypothetical protein
MTDDTAMRMDYRSDPSGYARCAWPGCDADATERYPVQLCQPHVLHIWSMVDADIRESGKTLDDLNREAAEEWWKSETVREQHARAKRLRDSKSGFVYYLEVGGMIKIGFTASPGQRGGQYPPSAELLAVHPGTLADEQKAHARFAAYRQAGREWYMDCQEIRDHVAEINAAEGKWRRSMRRRPARGTQPVKSATPRDVRIVG